MWLYIFINSYRLFFSPYKLHLCFHAYNCHLDFQISNYLVDVVWASAQALDPFFDHCPMVPDLWDQKPCLKESQQSAKCPGKLLITRSLNYCIRQSGAEEQLTQRSQAVAQMPRAPPQTEKERWLAEVLVPGNPQGS